VNSWQSIRIRLALWSLACLCALASFAFAFKSGCSGDLKTGALGNPQEALHFEELSVPLSWLASVAAASAVAFGPGRLNQERVALAIGALLLGVFGLALVEIQFEGWGIQACLSAK
jgi:hypothetical protein